MRHVRLALTLSALALTPLPLSPAYAGTLDTVYAVSVRGFPVGQAELKGEFADGHYSIQFSGGISGLARLFSDARTTAAASGALEDGRLDPGEYQHLWTEADDTETVAMRFADRRLTDISRDPPEKHPERYVPLTEADKEDVLDPVSAFVWPVADVTPEICGRTLPLMDGKRRFDLELAFSRVERFETRDGSFSGSAVVCSLQYKAVAGHRIGKTDTITTKSPMEVWMAPAGDGLAVPARIQLSTRMGRVVMIATKLTVR